MVTDQETPDSRPPLPGADLHIHLRGGMTVEKAVARQCATGLQIGVLKNLGRGWPIETDDQLAAFLDSVSGHPVFAGVQVNDRDWFIKRSAELLGRLDFVLADTMIMAMPDNDSTPVKLWMPELYSIPDPEAWMERYMTHNLRILAEPISILANPTYLPPAVAEHYETLWTDARMEQVIQAALDSQVALEIQARSQYPSDHFIRMAKSMGAVFSFGSNNFHDNPIDMSRCVSAVETFSLTPGDLYVPARPLLT
ncbi:MAG: hypothetical protein HN742_18175 [Lentisphaerae bacterium]|jgi:hypothetical protein|nr:hypothetical protein [Lentisphaerota bacterium]MBT4815248.1 hypothetical protein [Lentisphaerota bacterium]MBT5611832.1 hypothetical protein [Lentisphaerota bacterium]MBT7059289.1 hypothetical protein [Lentisphaerota bacterium]MBT7843812.1 hypothetical protein [Lentisphaerota bacterium]